MPEIVIEGVTEPDRLRDWLYERMRGAKGLQPAGLETAESNGIISNAARPDEATEILREIRDNLAQLVQRSESKNDA
jgi:putative membrane protein